MAPTIHSDTDAMKPALAWVTRMPCALAAATSMVRMSTAQRTTARTSASAASSAASTGVCR